MDVMQAIRGRRSIRKFKTAPVSPEDLNTVLEAARQAPSWANSQCWRFVVVTGQETKDQLARCFLSRDPTRENRGAVAVRTAPITIVACAQKKKSGYSSAGTPFTVRGEWSMYDVGVAMQNLVLAAYALGLGTVHIGLFDHKRVEEVLGVPEDIEVIAMTPLGYPDEAIEPRPRKELKEIVFRNRYGQQ
ncbi:MAG: nitroreductase family protein [Dehalococcoidia bacterium]|nr:nitroreductase family protein [Dehalococcoidia bacterium]